MSRVSRLLAGMLAGNGYWAPAGDEGGGGGGGAPASGTGDAAAPTVTAADARAFLKDHVADTIDLTATPDDKVLALHGRLKPLVDRATGDWAPDWRQKMAKGDEKALKQLERYASPADVWTKARALEQRMSSGELRSILPKDATEDQVKAWRAENGIPEAPDKYELNLREGLVLGEEDKPVVQEFLKAAHGANYTTAQASAAAEWYLGLKEQQAQAQAEKDVAAKQAGEDELRAEFGGEFRKNINLVTGLISSMPEKAANALLNGRAADGTPFMSHPDIIRGLLDIAKLANPAGVHIGADGEPGMAKTIDAEIAEIEKVMREDRASYNKNEKMQARLRELYTARDTMKARNQKAA